MRRSTLLAVVLPILLVSPVFAEVPERMNFQGRLTDTLGSPLSGSFDLTFRIYDDSVAGSLLYDETHTAVSVADGLFSVLIGGKSLVAPFGDYLFDGPDRFLSVQVGADPELTARARLVTSPYAFRVSTVDGASGGVVDGDLQVDGAVHSSAGGFRFPDSSI